MKNLILLSFILVASIAEAQTPFSMVSSANKKNQPAKISANSLNNPWVGAKLAYNVVGDVSNSFLLSGRAMYIFDQGENYAIPVIANVGISNVDSLDEDSGVSIGIYPWYTILRKQRKVINLHGSFNYHIADITDAGSISDTRLFVGAEAAFYPKEPGGMPATISCGPEYIINTAGGTGNSFVIDISGVLPIANGLGLLIESDIPIIKSPISTGLKIGVIINNSIK